MELQDGAARDHKPEGKDDPLHFQSGALPLDPEANSPLAEKYDMKLDDTLTAFFSKGVPLVNLFLVFSFVGKMLYHHQLPTGLWLMSLSIILLTCVVLSLLIHLGMIRGCWIRHVERRCKIAYLSTVLRISTAAALLLFLDTVNAMVVLPVLLLVLPLVTYWFWQTFYMGVYPGKNWKDYKDELDLRFEMSTRLVPMAFGGLSGKVLGQKKGSSNLMTGGYMAVAVAPECLLFCGVVLGLLVVLLSTVPPQVSIRRYRERMAKVHIRNIAYASLLFLALASAMAAENMVEYFFLVCLAIVVAAVIFYCWERRAGQTLPIAEPTAHEDSSASAHGFLYVLPAYFTPLFAALLMASHSKYAAGTSSTASLSWWFKGFVISAVCSIISYTIRIVLFAEMRDKKSWVISRKACSFATNAAMVTAAGFAVLVICLRLDEVKNIF